MEPRPCTSSSCMNAGGGMPEVAQQQANPTPGPSTATPRPCLTNPVDVPPHFLVPPEQLLPHQVRSGIDIGNLFKLLNALQNRIALACSQHQYLRDPEHHPKPPDTGAYKPLTPEAAVGDIRSLYRQQRNLMEKLRRWNCVNEGNCYDLIVRRIYTGICEKCEPFVASQQLAAKVAEVLRKERRRTLRRAMRKMRASAAAAAAEEATSTSTKQHHKRTRSVTQDTVSSSSELFALPPPPVPKKRRKVVVDVDCEPPHPDTFLSQESFLSELGLVTPEVFRRVQLAMSRRTVRRRRTTANPKYKSGGVDDPNETERSKRSRRSDPSSLPEPVASKLPSRTGAERRKDRQKRYVCTVCEKGDVTIQCSNCLSGFHTDCIKVSASKAPPPSTVSTCPNCVACNPNISASDCILLSRKNSRPSIMGRKTGAEAGPHSNQTSGRNQKVAVNRRKVAAAKKSQKSRPAPPPPPKPKPKKTGFKPPLPESGANKKAKVNQNSKPSKVSSTSSRPTLNQKSAIAAAAAVPAYCSVKRPPEEAQPMIQSTEVVLKVIPPVGIKWNKNHKKLRPTKRRSCLKLPITAAPPPRSHFENLVVKKIIPVKAPTLAAKWTCAKPASKCKKIEILAHSQEKNTPPPKTIIPIQKQPRKKEMKVVVAKTLIPTKGKKVGISELNLTEPAKKKQPVAKSREAHVPVNKKVSSVRPVAVSTQIHAPVYKKVTVVKLATASLQIHSPVYKKATGDNKPGATSTQQTQAAVSKKVKSGAASPQTHAPVSKKVIGDKPRAASPQAHAPVYKKVTGDNKPGATSIHQTQTPVSKKVKSGAVSPQTKKVNGVKPGAVDPFCMKRTMMAMSAAAGIVMMTNGLKLPASPVSTAPTSGALPVANPKAEGGTSMPAKSPSPPIKAVAGPSGVKPSNNNSVLKLQAAEENINVSTPTKNVKKQPKPKVASPSNLPKPVVKMDPILEQSISDTISRVVFESAHGLYLDKTDRKENLLQKVSRNIMDNELHRQRTASASTDSLSGHQTNDLSPPPPSLTDCMEDNMRFSTNERNPTVPKSGMNTEEKGDGPGNEQERCESPASDSSTIGSPRSLREVESDDDDSFELPSIPGTPMR